MKLFWDCEFTGLHQQTTLISIGCVSENGKQFYAELDDYDTSQLNPWLMENVVSKLWIQNPEIHASKHVAYFVGNVPDIADRLRYWLYGLGPEVEMWGDVLAYDWVLFCQLFGGAMNIPANVYYIPFDLATLMKIKGVDPDINRQEFAGMLIGDKNHNALFDAQTTAFCYWKLMAT